MASETENSLARLVERHIEFIKKLIAENEALKEALAKQ